MFLYVGFAALLALTKFSLSIVGWKDTNMRRATLWNAGIYIVLMVILVGVFAFASLDGLILFQVFLYTAIGAEFIVRLYERCYRKQRTAKTWLYFLSLILFGGAYGIWVPSQSGGPLCFPESVFQGHAVWHVLSALSIGVIFYYHLSDHTIDRQEQGSGGGKYDAGDALHSQGVVGGSQAVTQEMDEPDV